MEIKKITIFATKAKVSHLRPEDEVEQFLVVDIDGHIYFHSIYYGGGYRQYQEGRTLEFFIDGNESFNIINYVCNYFAKHGSWGVIPGLGSWKMTMMDNEEKNYEYYGSLTGAHNELTDYIRQRIHIDNLYVFSNEGF